MLAWVQSSSESTKQGSTESWDHIVFLQWDRWTPRPSYQHSSESEAQDDTGKKLSHPFYFLEPSTALSQKKSHLKTYIINHTYIYFTSTLSQNSQELIYALAVNISCIIKPTQKVSTHTTAKHLTPSNASAQVATGINCVTWSVISEGMVLLQLWS